MSISGMTFTKNSTNFIYSDSPEAFTVSSNSLLYQWGCSIGTSFKDFEMYHHLYNGDMGNTQFRAGIAVQNLNSSAITITYICAGNAINESSSDGDSKALTVTPNVLKTYLNSSTKTITVPAKSVKYIDGYTGNFTKGYAKFVTVRGKIKSSVSSNVYIRLFVAGANKISSISELFGLKTYEKGNSNYFTGELSYTQKNVSLNANSTATYRFFEWPTEYNKNEYTGVVTNKPTAASIHAGNFGVIYKLNISNASGKKIKITPSWTASRTKATIVYRINSGGWIARDVISTGACWYLSLGNSSSATFEMILPGGNHGNFDVTFD